MTFADIDYQNKLRTNEPTPLEKARATPRKEVFHTVRTNSGGTKELKLTRGLAIKLMCTECMGFEQNPVECTEKLCPLYPYRKKSLAAYDKKETQETNSKENAIEMVQAPNVNEA